MNESKIDWYLSNLVGYDPIDNMPIFYQEGNSDSSVTLPTGPDARYLAEGCLVRHTDNNQVMTYNKKTDSWKLLLEFSS